MTLSNLMRQVLLDIAEGRGTHHNCHGRSEHGGRSRVLTALMRRKLIDHEYRLTALAREVLK